MIKKIGLYGVIGITVFILVITIGEYFINSHYTGFTIDDRYKVELYSDECGTCFLDWQIDFKIGVSDLLSNEKYVHYFWMAEGPYIEFGLPKDSSNRLLIYGSQNNSLQSYIVDFDQDEITEMSYFVRDKVPNEYKITHLMNGEFEIHEVK